MRRHLSNEWMDDPAVNPRELAQALSFIRAVNRRLGGEAALLHHLRAWSQHWPRGQTITLLDIGTGSADLPIAASRWARSAGFDLRITAIDLHERTLECARSHINTSGATNIELLRADALCLANHFGVDSFDYVHAGMFLHHLPDVQVMTVLAAMDRVARRGIIWNDLIRSRLAWLAIQAITLGQSAMIRHDARVSVEAGFTRRDVLDIRHRLDLTYTRWRSSFLTQRFTLAGEKPHMSLSSR